jgi:hypothetical protein
MKNHQRKKAEPLKLTLPYNFINIVELLIESKLLPERNETDRTTAQKEYGGRLRD